MLDAGVAGAEANVNFSRSTVQHSKSTTPSVPAPEGRPLGWRCRYLPSGLYFDGWLPTVNVEISWDDQLVKK
jgi:hypothetical protein